MENIIEKFDNKINIDKEVISVLPRNNKKNKKIYVDKLLELRNEYSDIQRNITNEIKRRSKKIQLVADDPEIEKISLRLEKFKDIITLINKYNTSYEKMKLDENLFVLRRFYKNNLEEINTNIKQCIKRFERVGVVITPQDFVYSQAANEYMTVFFEEMNRGDVNSQRIKDSFEEIYWKCSDVIIHIEMNINYIYIKKKKIIDKYFQAKKESLLKNLKMTEDELLKAYMDLQREYIEAVNKDSKTILEKFLNRELDTKDFEEKQVDTQYSKILIEPNKEYTEEEFETINQSIVKLSKSLYEYKNYLEFQFVADKAEKMYKEKNQHKNEYESQLKKIAKEEKKIIAANEKYQKVKKRRESRLFKKKNVELLEKINLDVNSKILEIKEMYRKLPEYKVREAISCKLNDFSTLYDAMALMSAFYSFLVEVIIEKYPDIEPKDIDVEVKKIRELIEFPYITITNNITVGTEKNLTLFIKDKYMLSSLNITKDDLDEQLLPNLIQKVNLLTNAYYLSKSNLKLDDIKFVLKSEKLINNK